MDERFPSFVIVFLLGALVGGVFVAGYGPALASGGGAAAPSATNPPTSASWGGPSCLSKARRPGAGWVHEVAAGRSYTVTLNATVVHDPGREPSVNVTRVAPGTYRIDLRTVPARDGQAAAAKVPADCPLATTVVVGTSLPVDFRRLEVTTNGRTIRTITREGTTPHLYRLPNTINATAS